MTTEQAEPPLFPISAMLDAVGPRAYVEIPAPQKPGQTAIIVWAIEWDDEATAWAVREYSGNSAGSRLIAHEATFRAALTYVARLFALSQNG